MPKVLLLMSLARVVCWAYPVLPKQIVAVPEPTAKALMIAGIISLTLLAIFLRKKLG